MNRTFTELKELVLIQIYEFTYHSNEYEWLSIPYIKHLCEDQVSTVFLGKVIDALEKEQFLEYQDVAGDPHYTIIPKGIARAEKYLASGASSPNGEKIIPASDRIVENDHNTAPTQEVERAIDAADEAIRSSNTLSDVERSWIRDHIAVGKGLLKLKKVSLSAVRSMLLHPLHSAWKHVAEEHGRVLIARAIEAIRLWLNI